MIYKFKDDIDGNVAFIVAVSLDEAMIKMKQLTGLPFSLVEVRPISEPIVLINFIVPF